MYDADGLDIVLPASTVPLKCSDLCVLDVNLLPSLGLEVKRILAEDSRLLPLVFSAIDSRIEIINGKDGSVVSFLGINGIIAAKWLLPFSRLCRWPSLADFGDNIAPLENEKDEFGIVTVDSGNVVAIYGRKELGSVTHDSPIFGISTAYIKTNDGGSSSIILSVTSVDVNGTIKRWFPFYGDLSVDVFRPLDRRVSAISEGNIVIDYSNYLYERSKCENKEEYAQGSLNKEEGYDRLIELSKFLAIGYTDGSVAVFDLEKLSIHALLHGKSQIRTLSLFVDSEGDFTISVFDGILKLYTVIHRDSNDENTVDSPGKMSEDGNSEVYPSYLSDTKYKALVIDDKLNICSMKVDANNRDIILLATTANRLLMFNYRTNRAMTFIGIPAGKLYLYHYSLDCNIYFNVISMDTHTVCVDLFRNFKVYSRIVTDCDFGVLSSSFLQPACIFSGSNNGVLNILDIGIDILEMNNMKFNERISEFYGITNNLSQPGDSDEATVKGDDKKSGKAKNWSKRLGIIDNYTLESFKLDISLPTKGIRTLKSRIKTLVHHPRIPSIIAVGCEDGSVNLIFIEAENTLLHHILFCTKFDHSVDQLVWTLTDRMDEDTEVDYKKLKSSFLERIWKSIESARYASVLVMQSEGDVRWVELSRSMNVESLDTIERPNYITVDAMDSYMDMMKRSKLSLIFSIKWPIEGYYMEYGSEKGVDAENNEDVESSADIGNVGIGTLTNFCNVKDSLAMLYYAQNSMYLYILSRFENSFILICPVLSISVNGIPTSVSISGKQYNQIYRHQASGYEMLYSRYSKASLDQSLCMNALQEFIAIGTNTGYVYATSLLYLYNLSIFSCKFPSGDSQSSFVPANGISGRKVGMSVDMLKFAVLWRKYDMNVNFTNPKRCMCTDDCIFILAIGVVGFGVKVCTVSNYHSEGTRSEFLKITPVFSRRQNYNSILWAEQALPNITRLLVGNGKSLKSFNFSYYLFGSSDNACRNLADLQKFLDLFEAMKDRDFALEILLKLFCHKNGDLSSSSFTPEECLLFCDNMDITSLLGSADLSSDRHLSVKLLIEICKNGKEEVEKWAPELLTSRMTSDTFLGYFNNIFLIYQGKFGREMTYPEECIEFAKSEIRSMGGIYLAILLVLLEDVHGAVDLLATSGLYAETFLLCNALNLPMDSTLCKAAEVVRDRAISALFFAISNSTQGAKEVLHKFADEELSQETKDRVTRCLDLLNFVQ
ncbi:hypothetical protein BEWA_050500 [Theileria equi strain WA]|uniref:Uncharacterized protein n=1 Tax=Theileria equi strain WA TaxID=1537102 RepID=L1LAU2_THEEQ|nr:hypothetical protein BEWA_050500 [Theileria equi strain WA]EKX72582.1 hypothetical protein BEWA_050500 [Theileria equi strain WA]|eukprot:XP_004832034.1 hypothetical protein BEWA_050500 [Theileria equi strain WA]